MKLLLVMHKTAVTRVALKVEKEQHWLFEGQNTHVKKSLLTLQYIYSHPLQHTGNEIYYFIRLIKKTKQKHNLYIRGPEPPRPWTVTQLWVIWYWAALKE